MFTQDSWWGKVCKLSPNLQKQITINQSWFVPMTAASLRSISSDMTQLFASWLYFYMKTKLLSDFVILQLNRCPAATTSGSLRFWLDSNQLVYISVYLEGQQIFTSLLIWLWMDAEVATMSSLHTITIIMITVLQSLTIVFYCVTFALSSEIKGGKPCQCKCLPKLQLTPHYTNIHHNNIW